MAFAEDFSNLDEDSESLEEEIEKAADRILEGNYKNAYSRLATETDQGIETSKDFRNPDVLLNQLAEESSFDEIPEYLSALAHESKGLYDLKEVEKPVKKFAEELKNRYSED
jgi:hypothetical protein